MTPSLPYLLLKKYVQLGLSIYFKKWQSANTHHIPEKGPFIFVANHQNAFMDAILVICGIKRNPWFLARGDVFKKNWAIKLLTFMRIMPVFRFRDGHGAMRRNDKIMTECVSILKNGNCILLFVEGNHNQPWTTQKLQRGFAHIALQYCEQTKKDIQLVPVGLHYEDHEAFRSRVLVNYGEPISVHSVTGNISDTREKSIPLLAHTEEKLRSLILTIPLDELYEQRRNFLIQNRIHKKDMVDQLDSDRQLLKIWTPENPEKKKVTTHYNWFNPLYLYGKLVHIIPHGIIHYVVKNKIKDDQFIGSVKLALGIFLIPLYYGLSTVAFYLVSGEPLWTFAFFLSLPISGLFAYGQR